MTPDPDTSSIAIHNHGCVLALTVKPRSSRTELTQLPDGTFHVRLTAAPVDGAANTALLRFLADVLDLPRSRLSLVSGATGPRKRVAIEGIGVDDLIDRVQGAKTSRK